MSCIGSGTCSDESLMTLALVSAKKKKSQVFIFATTLTTAPKMNHPRAIGAGVVLVGLLLGMKIVFRRKKGKKQNREISMRDIMIQSAQQAGNDEQAFGDRQEVGVENLHPQQYQEHTQVLSQDIYQDQQKENVPPVKANEKIEKFQDIRKEDSEVIQDQGVNKEESIEVEQQITQEELILEKQDVSKEIQLDEQLQKQEEQITINDKNEIDKFQSIQESPDLVCVDFDIVDDYVYIVINGDRQFPRDEKSPILEPGNFEIEKENQNQNDEIVNYDVDAFGSVNRSINGVPDAIEEKRILSEAEAVVDIQNQDDLIVNYDIDDDGNVQLQINGHHDEIDEKIINQKQIVQQTTAVSEGVESSVQVQVQVVQDGSVKVVLDYAENQKKIVGQQQELEQEEELSESETQAQKMVGMANQLWGNGAPTEIKRAVKMQKAALDILLEHHPQSVHLAQVASSLADMQYAQNDLKSARESLQMGLDAANRSGDLALQSKLSNNLGQVLRKMGMTEASRKLHQEYMQRFEPEFGVGHHYTCLARQNLIDTLETLGRLEEAAEILEQSSQTCITAIQELESTIAPDAAGLSAQDENQIGDGVQHDEAKPFEKEVGEEGEDMEFGEHWTYICSGRVLTEQARFEIAHSEEIGDLNKAETLLRLALRYIEKGEGIDGDSSATPLSYLGKVLSKKEDDQAKLEALECFERLRQISVRRDGEKSQSVALVLHSKAEVFNQLKKYPEAVQAEEETLEILQGILKQKYHMALIKHYELLARIKLDSGDQEGSQAAMKAVLKCKSQHNKEQLKQKRTVSSKGGSTKSSSSSSKRGKKKTNK
eukprot:TRINITY_DN2760_c0_g1_i6.p1 TRINITY_DN2760_c0_g1~~TRINITY_DN2760_c0_g1_i6.p1  ORF type:complete len:826 (+),score=181.25 TRINITY_DN2760_c0_g1_i6:182-2659(+)